METTILLTDTHFGVKNNSMTWLNSQTKFIYDQLIPYIKNLKKDMGKYDSIRVIHLGDVFDSRSSISTMVATKVVECFGEISSLVDDFYIIAGNHDYYSPNSDKVNTLDLLFCDMGITLVTNKIRQVGNDLLVPWYEWGKPEIQDWINNKGIKRIFTHADIITERIPYIGAAVYSGHLHTPDINSNILRFNLGSCYSLTFADANSHRGFYVLRNDKLTFQTNISSIRFWRLYDEDIFDDYILSSIQVGDYIELYISESNMSDPKYIEKLNFFTQTYKNIWIIPQTGSGSNYELEKFEGYDIEKITKNMIPDELKSKFEVVLNSCNKSLIMKNE